MKQPIERKTARRWRAQSPELLLPERRDGFDRRALASAMVRTGAVRVGFAEAPPRRERRRFPEAGME